jgi:4'-phosphopantetheinyl transferase
MSVKVYFSQYSSLRDESQLDTAWAKLPLSMREKIAAYKDPVDRQLRISGKLQLLRLIDDFKLLLTLNDLKYTAFHKPYFDGGLDFSIAHCDGAVICAGTMGAKIGVDIEPIKEIDIRDYRRELTINEYNMIEQSEDPSKAFLQIWTKKEALLKATGRGIDMDMGEVDVSSDGITVHGERYLFLSLSAYPKYITHLAVSYGAGNPNPINDISYSFMNNI